MNTEDEMNRELMLKVAEKVRDFPEHHDQTYWVHHPDRRVLVTNGEPPCGTTMCSAGWAMALSGFTLESDESTEERWIAPNGEESSTTRWTCTAADLLGLSYDAADALFYAPNDIFGEGALMKWHEALEIIAEGDEATLYRVLDAGYEHAGMTPRHGPQ